MIKLMKITIYFAGGQKTYYNISRTAVKYYIAYHQENPDFYGYALD